MGSFKGHALPGTFFIIMGFWWGTKSILKYVYKKQTRTCYLSSKTLLRRAEIWEGVVSIFMALTGIVGEQFISGGPYLILYKDGQWNQLLGWHHTTMYFFFGLQGATHILCFTTNFLPLSLSKLMLSNAIFVESFIFYNHTHGREMLDVFVHQLLVFTTILTGLVTFMEFLAKNNVLLELLRSSLIILQGTWFWQIAFVLYPLSGSPPWNLTDIENKMFLTMCFSWHYASTFIIIGLNYTFITWLTSGPHLLRGWGVFGNSTRMQGKTLLRVRSPPEPADDYCLFMFQKPSDA
ncbi:transmembrane protein 45A-like isoform X1 [Peromyscus maniculatus bairdii]|uniref:transmembrane protein 45A-like isoform X1 n=1 Tax=Peromyscus maniculatus bairdii TaxID=230844 RepID=UPI001C2E9BC1|nr:transmembrane protein 45A-like isoform X1 [Peromyscus maniculatus bairdii]XP_042115370.1 transmembrane protein 45A-like isoform X1 [Peromyscus maniculatus bairdii]